MPEISRFYGIVIVLQWAAAHQAELQADWARARAQLPLVPIAPLD